MREEGGAEEGGGRGGEALQVKSVYVYILCECHARCMREWHINVQYMYTLVLPRYIDISRHNIFATQYNRRYLVYRYAQK